MRPAHLAGLLLGLLLLLVVASPSLAQSAAPGYSVVKLEGMIPPSPQNNAGWYMLLDSEGTTSNKHVLGSSNSFILAAPASSGLWFKVDLRYGDQANITLNTSSGRTFHYGYQCMATGGLFSFGSGYVNSWFDLPPATGGASSFSDNGAMVREGDSIFFRYAKNYLTNQTGIEVRIGTAGRDLVIPNNGAYDTITNVSISSPSLLTVTMYYTSTAIINATANSGASSPVVGSTDLVALANQAIETLVSVFNTVVVVLGVAFALFKIFVIEHGVTTFLLLELGGFFFALQKYKNKIGGLFPAFRDLITMNDKLIRAVIDFSGAAINMLAIVVQALVTAIQAGAQLVSGVAGLAIGILKALL